jgi:hygromycin-B 4-O-kinase
MDGDALSAEEVVAFLERHHGARVEDLEALGGGWWSSAWGYRVGAEELVVRLGHDVSWYEADHQAMNFARRGLPIPQVRDVGLAFENRAYAISVRHHGIFLEDAPIEVRSTLASTLTHLLVALHSVPSGVDENVLWHQPGASPITWRQFLLSGLVDDPSSATHGWSAALSADDRLSALATGVEERIRSLVSVCPERRDLVHADLLHGNVLISPDAARVEAVFSWKCSVRGDFLYDAAWLTFWAPWHAGIAAVNPLAGLIAAASIQDDPGSLVDAALRHHCYELHIGFTHLGWNIWTNNRVDLEATARRLEEVFERGPMSLPGSVEPPR